MNNNSMQFLRSRMDTLGYESLEPVAVAMGINRGNLYRYFAGQTVPSAEMIPVMCTVLEVTPMQLMEALNLVTNYQRKQLSSMGAQ